MKKKQTEWQQTGDRVTVVDENDNSRKFIGVYKGFILEEDDTFVYATLDDNPLTSTMPGLQDVHIQMKSESQFYIEGVIDKLTAQSDDDEQALDVQSEPKIRMIKDYENYQLVRLHNTVYGITKSIGKVDLTVEGDRKRTEILCGQRVEQVETLIDKLQLLDKLQQWYEINKA